jgi:hypothetical protein
MSSYTTFPGVSTPVTTGSDKAWAPKVPFGHTPYTWAGAAPSAPTNTNSAVLNVIIDSELPKAAETAPEAAAAE